MRKSFVRMVAGSVVFFWVAGFALLLSYSRSLRWTEAWARSNGVFLAHEILDDTPPEQRERRLQELQTQLEVGIATIPMEQVEERTGRRPRVGGHAYFVEEPMRHWYFIPFSNGSRALVAGPMNPGLPTGVIPVGAILAFVLVPLIAAVIALRVERGIAPVEAASRTLAAGDFSTRVTGAAGPSTELADTFNQMAERVERLIKSRDELVQAVSHELGSPLSRLRFHLALLEGEGSESERHSAMAAELDALEELVAELLRYVQSDDLQLEVHPFAPAASLRDVAELTQVEVPEERELAVHVEVPEDAMVYVDARLFLRACENLLRNAVRHAESQVRIELSAAGEEGVVSVHDDGPGIPEPMREKVLSPFVRVESDRGRSTGGAGLGLAIVRRIVERHGGDIEIGESPLGGAKVTLRWPTVK